ncbi:MAG TPA: cytochrome c [Lacunisphaera sp.]|jgi:mono/diheme cytochrome c family protein
MKTAPDKSKSWNLTSGRVFRMYVRIFGHSLKPTRPEVGFHREERTRRAVAVILVALIVALSGCDNMQRQRGAKDVTLEKTDPPAVWRAPAHTVARGSPAPGDSAFTGFRDGQPLAKNPLPVTRELLARGRERFDIYCAVCHGRDGYGQGIVVRRGFPAPPSYHQDRLRDAPDGHFYDVMTRGYGAMLPFADRLTSHDRWAVVAYVRALQLSQHSILSALPPEEQTQLAKQ